MGFNKQIPFEITEYKVFNQDSPGGLEKTASELIPLPSDFTYDPDYLYIWLRIVSSGQHWGPNKNGDYFPEEELIEYYQTFEDAHAFKNHENKKVEQAIGKIISVRWNDRMKCVEIFKGIDKKIAPEIARGYIKGYLTDFSMGCRVPYTVCSICGNVARRREDFCLHIRKYRLEYLENGERVFEINYKPKFHDSSSVLNGAERVAKAGLIIDMPIDANTPYFTKKASDHGAYYIRLNTYETEKIASYKVQERHPLLSPRAVEKQTSDFLQKVAEIEKRVTGKIIDLVSKPTPEQREAGGDVLKLIKFMTSKRMNEDTLSQISKILQQIADTEKLSPRRVFAIFLGIAELLGIELFPTELHTIVSKMNAASANSRLALSHPGDDIAKPTMLARMLQRIKDVSEPYVGISDPGELFSLYDEAGLRSADFASDPKSFIKYVSTGDEDLEAHAPVRIVKVIRKTLEPLMPSRSTFPDFLLPRLAATLVTGRPIEGDREVARDIQILSRPETLGDLLAGISYRNYQEMRPRMIRMRMIQLAALEDNGLLKTAMPGIEKVASEVQPWTAGKWLSYSIPLAFGASIYEKNKREHGRMLSPTEDFIADHPLVAGALPAVFKGPFNSMRSGIVNGSRTVADDLGKPFGLNRTAADDSFTGMVKTAADDEATNWNVFTPVFLAKTAAVMDLTPEQMAGLKVATLLSTEGEEKQAREILDYYDLNSYHKDVLLKAAAVETDVEMQKIANEFLINLVGDAYANPAPFSPSLPGRTIDAFLFTKLMEKLMPKQSPGAQASQAAQKVDTLHRAYQTQGRSL